MPIDRLTRSGRLLAAATLAGVLVSEAAFAQAAKGAFPPFDTSKFPSQLFWLAVSFAVLYWLMSTIALPRVGSILHERATTIARDLDNATAMQAKAEETAAAYEKALAEARKNAQGIAQAARDAGAKASDERRKAVEADLAGKLSASEATIAQTKATAMGNVRELGSDVAAAIVARLTGQTPSPDEAARAVDTVLARG